MRATEDAVAVSTNGSDGYRATYGSQLVTPSYAIVVALSKVTGNGITELGPLNEDVDTDALNTLFTGGSKSDGGTVVSFHFEGYTVNVEADGSIALEPDTDSGNGQIVASQQG